ncbi:di-trans,poly-cis-decaprenylcistransferase [Zhengella mangrovi]|uniref:Isoprenyl transferase n=1 Tax=Zhengella mangrovi TaxID=1982044 RepID=A0A2G1QQL1_9HYPH|nr:isoprenyl transferase [Zhengella mangrovi]PHP67857.1 di-trans,poly-cis-decaprenylcistransferase [Zhengella mangrovi]
MTQPAHVAIIMDGNGRWAKQRHLPRSAGHKAGVEALRRAVRAAGDIGLEYLSVFAFSSENWNRPAGEVSDLLGLFRLFVRRDLAELHANGVRVRMIGDRDGLSADLVSLIDEAEVLTRDNTGLTLVIAFNYGSQDEITRAMRRIALRVERGELAPADITPETVSAHLDTAGIPDPDLLIRTSGELRLSNFLLWQAAYTEFLFLDCYWPDFSERTLREAVEAFSARDRRFGGVAPQDIAL